MTERGSQAEFSYNFQRVRPAWYPHPLASCMMPIGALLALALLGYLGILAWQSALPGDTTVPVVVGKSREDGVALLRRAGLRIEVLPSRENSEKIPEDSIISVIPPEGRNVKKGRTVRMLLSAGTQFAKVPDVVHVSLDTARGLIKDADLKVATEDFVYDDEVPLDGVISIAPKAGTKVVRGSVVNLVVSKGSKEDEAQSLVDPNLRSSVLTVDLPSDEAGPAEARIDVTDDAGTHTVYNETHNPGDTVVYTVQGLGETTVEVYFGSRLVLTRKL